MSNKKYDKAVYILSYKGAMPLFLFKTIYNKNEIVYGSNSRMDV